jgi:uncharacterized protein
MKIHQKIAIIGTARSGKTVFLTSLINHLMEHNHIDFRIGKNNIVTIRDMKILPVSKKIGGKFNYSAYRDALVHQGKWPEKTRDTSHVLCNFKRSDWKWNRSELHFFDLPGERIADAAIAQYENYAEWSDHVLENINGSTPYRELAGEFLGALNNIDGCSVSELINSYKLALAHFYINFRTMITPSTFILDQNGQTPKSRTKEEFLSEHNKCFSGLGPGKDNEDQQFVPLPEKIREKKPELVQQFVTHYKLYRKQIAKPIFDHLKSCNRLIVLVDIPSLLNGGVAMYNDNRQILEDLFNILQPESWLMRLFSSHTKLNRVAFVATKSDIVHPADIDKNLLLNLLREMTDKFAVNLSEFDVERKFFTCSAIVSAQPADGEYQMRGLLRDNKNPELSEKIFSVPKLPPRWPEDWKYGDFKFPSVWPRIPANKAIPPKHDGLDKIFDFITED